MSNVLAVTEVSQSSASTLAVDHSIDSSLLTAQQPDFSNGDMSVVSV